MFSYKCDFEYDLIKQESLIENLNLAEFSSWLYSSSILAAITVSMKTNGTRTKSVGLYSRKSLLIGFLWSIFYNDNALDALLTQAQLIWQSWPTWIPQEWKMRQYRNFWKISYYLEKFLCCFVYHLHNILVPKPLIINFSDPFSSRFVANIKDFMPRSYHISLTL